VQIAKKYKKGCFFLAIIPICGIIYPWQTAMTAPLGSGAGDREMIPAFHGLSAYRRTRMPMEFLRRAQTIEGLHESPICVADRPVGQIGLIVWGQIEAAFSGDCWSWLENGARVSYADPDLLQPGAAEWARLAARAAGYSEAWMSHPTPLRVWVAQRASRRTKRIAEVLARYIARKYPVEDSVLVVDRSTSIMSIYSHVFSDFSEELEAA
jgi:hypothetical protein